MVDAFETSGSSPPRLPDELVEPLAEILADAVVEYIRRKSACKSASVQTPVPNRADPPRDVPVAA
jgi:hypothetical protein